MMLLRDENRMKKASKTWESALRTGLPSKTAQQYTQVRIMSKGKELRSAVSGETLSRDAQLLWLSDAQVGKHTAARTCSDFQMNFVDTLACFGHCFPTGQPNVLVSTVAE